MMSFGFLLRSACTDVPRGVFCQHVQRLHASLRLLAVDKSLLMKLRKSTGYTFSNCKKALEKFDNDISQAEPWLHEQAQKEGWSKASKLEGRKANQGLVGVLKKDQDAVIVEVNCETDFVARNDKFQRLVKDVALATLTHHQRNQTSRAAGLVKVRPAMVDIKSYIFTLTTDNAHIKSVLTGEQLHQLSVAEGTSLADQVALAIGGLGENLSVKRAVTVGVPADWHIGSYVHGAVGGQAEVAMGRYAALVVFEGGEEEELLGRQLGQHVVGEAPESLGHMDDLPGGESERRLLAQTFLLDPSRTVAQFLRGHGARVLDFVRFQCGETEEK